jgi:hypothetical protein
MLPAERWCCFAVSPQTLRRWHRTLLEGDRRGRRRKPSRPPLGAETRALIGRLGGENPRWGYMRIQGELLKLGIGVSATTVATVLRSSGLGPAPRRLGPSWSEFLRAQAQSMLGGDLSPALADGSAAGKDGLEGSAPEPSRPARDGSGRQVEADDNLSPVGAAEPRHAYQPRPARSRSARPLALPATRAPLRPQPSHRSHARDGPPRAGPRSCPTTECSTRHVRPSPVALGVLTNHASDLSADSHDPQDRGVSATGRPRPQADSLNRLSLPHKVFYGSDGGRSVNLHTRGSRSDDGARARSRGPTL